MRYLIRFSYDGTNFHGYQVQPGLLTVQGQLEKALTSINNGKKVVVQSSGRTDAGVHALDQAASFDLDVKIALFKIKMAINSNVTSDIHVISVEEVKDDFHARYMVTSKEYIYILNMGEYNPIERNYVYQYNKKLDVDKMGQAISYFLGEHDFRAFVSSEDKRENSVRTIMSANIVLDNDKVIFTFIGSGFLKYQVRNMVGTLIKIGEDKLEVDSIKQILLEKNRSKAGKTAPSEGLYLKKVNY